MFDANVEYAMSPSGEVVSGFQVGVLSVRVATNDRARFANGNIETISGYCVDHIPSGFAISHLPTLAAALFVADTLSLTAPEHKLTVPEGIAWVGPYIDWVQGIAALAERDQTLITYRAYQELIRERSAA